LISVTERNSSPSGEIKNEDIYIWLDILGWAQAIENQTEYAKLYALLNKFQNLFFEINEIDDIQIISDGLILKISINTLDELKAIINAIAQLQFKFINDNKFFIRGGIAFGTKHSDEENGHLISNGLARAVKVESSFVNYPIIGTNKKFIEKIKDKFHMDIDDYEYIGLKKSFNYKAQELYFIDFIQKDENYKELLSDNIDKYKNNPYIKSKYLWLLEYYLAKFENIGINGSEEGKVLV
jgi:hypothetical protein